jgi:hypothetical protein
MKTILSLPVMAAKAIIDILSHHDETTEQIRHQQYKAQIIMMTLSR